MSSHANPRMPGAPIIPLTTGVTFAHGKAEIKFVPNKSAEQVLQITGRTALPLSRKDKPFRRRVPGRASVWAQFPNATKVVYKVAEEKDILRIKRAAALQLPVEEASCMYPTFPAFM